MEDTNKNLQSNFSKEMKNRFLNYAMSVIVARALPVVNDGLKPVHRRILYAMHELHLYPEKAYKKSARIVGEVIGKFHPHGDAAVYEAMTKMIQDFNSNYPLIDGHGNFGSIDGDSPAAMRYTEVRLSKVAMAILKDLKKNTVNFVDNYDGSEKEPAVLPGLIPNLLANGTIGIAVGMATSIPPHNLNEILEAIIYYLKNPDIDVETLINKEIFNGPDFPTKGLIVNTKEEMIDFYKKGHGSIKMRGRYLIEKNEKNTHIIFTEIPYQVNKSKLIKDIVVLIKNKKLEQILDLRDESNRFGIRIVIILKKGAQTKVFLKRLFKLTSLNVNFSMNMLALYQKQPQIMNLLTIFKHYTAHQINILVRKTTFNLKNDQQRREILEGLQKALQKIDLVIALIKKSNSQSEAQKNLQKTLQINERQSKAILEMRLQRLTALEQQKITDEINVLNIRIIENQKILNDPQYQKEIIIKTLKTLKKDHGKKRQTEIITTDEFTNISEEDLIKQKDVLICLTENNYLKAMDLKHFHVQNRGGVGVRGVKLNEKDIVRRVIHASVHDKLLFFTENGKVYRLKAYKIPELGRNTKGIPAQNLINIKQTEKITNIICVDHLKENDDALCFITKKGIVKKTLLKEFDSIRSNGKIAIKLKENDRLKFIHSISKDMDVVIGKDDNRIVRFAIEGNIRPLARSAKGVIGARLTKKENKVVSSSCCFKDQKILTISSNGKGKLLKVEKIRQTRRGALGVKVVKSKNDLIINQLIASLAVNGNEKLLIAKTSGKFQIIDLKQVKIRKSRSSTGVKIVNLDNQEKICALCIYRKEENNSDKL